MATFFSRLLQSQSNLDGLESHIVTNPFEWKAQRIYVQIVSELQKSPVSLYKVRILYSSLVNNLPINKKTPFFNIIVAELNQTTDEMTLSNEFKAQLIKILSQIHSGRSYTGFTESIILAVDITEQIDIFVKIPNNDLFLNNTNKLIRFLTLNKDNISGVSLTQEESPHFKQIAKIIEPNEDGKIDLPQKVVIPLIEGLKSIHLTYTNLSWY